MEHRETIVDHPKRRRRRRDNRSPLSGYLLPDDGLRGNIGRISRNLFAELFSYPSASDYPSSETYYLAVSPWAPLADDLLEEASWTILPVQAGEEPEGSTQSQIPLIKFPARSLALRGLAEAYELSAFAKSNRKGSNGIEVRILDVEPLSLDTVYVTVNRDALDKHDEMQRKFGGGFNYSGINGFTGKSKGKAKAAAHSDSKGNSEQAKAQEMENRLTLAVREALASSQVVHQNHLLQLPLPAHPITHVPFSPAMIALCEPVRQGLLTDATKIVVNRMSHENSIHRNLLGLAGKKGLQALPFENGDDTSNEKFFSAAENDEKRQIMGSPAIDSVPRSDSSENDSDESSDDSLQNMISMNTPELPNQASSARSVATPRGRASRTNGISTPGSVFSNFTTTTARQGFNAKAKLFKAKGLLFQIPNELLHPKPSTEEDDEARIFVDMKTLVKIGCFSGDWVRIEATSSPQAGRSGFWSLDAFAPDDDHDDSRPVKIYGLSGLSQKFSPRYPRKGGTERRPSVPLVSGSDATGVVAWLSPILLANLGQTEYIKLAPLLANAPVEANPNNKTRVPKIEACLSPPVATEMTLLRISTPLATERPLQTGIFTALKQHFESKRRILRQGDLIALAIDTSISRLIAQPVGASDVDRETEELLSLLSPRISSGSSKFDIVWFRVGHISIGEWENRSPTHSDGIWGGAGCIEPMSTRMRQAGSEPSKIPPALAIPWQQYLSSRSPSRSLNRGTSMAKYASLLPDPYIVPLRRRLRELLAASTSPRALQLNMSPVFVLLRSNQRSIGKATLAFQAASDLGVHVFQIDAHDITAEGGSAGEVKTEALFKARVERALSCGPASTVILLRHIEALTAERIVSVLKETLPQMRAIIATTIDIENVSEGFRSIVTHELEVVAPDEGEREGILKSITEERAIRLARDVDLRSIAIKSAALVAGDLVDIVERALISRQERLEQLVSERPPGRRGHERLLKRDVLVSGGEQACCVIKADFDLAIEAGRKNFADAIGAPKIPNVSWDDVGGLENVKDAVMETIQLPLQRPELFAKGMKKRSGILFYGPPGTGKTLLAKAIATEFSLNFFSVKGPELLNMYIGESEANVRRVFQRARDARPCVVFFDELDSVAPKRGNQGDSGGVMDRIVSQLLAELDGMSNGDEGGAGVFVIGATNRPDLLDQALLRPGRFDKMLYLGVSDSHDKQLTIIEALTRKFTMDPELSLRRVAESLPFTYTGADLYALCSDAMLKAITRQASAVDAKIKERLGGPVTTAYFFDHLATAEDISVMVTENDFAAAQKELVGSIR